jgi:ribosome assembly protein YihI (activator of Der GTPase)
MSWLTSGEEPKVLLELTIPELRHVIASLLYCMNDPNLSLEDMETNDRMIHLLLQLENDLVLSASRDTEEEDYVREHGEL